MDSYYQDDFATIYHGDCRDVLPGVAFDSVVTDAPYGVSVDYADHSDSVEALDSLIAALSPVLTDGRTHALFPGVANMHRWPQPRWTLCWYEPAGTGVGRWGFATWHPVLVYGSDPFAGKGSRPDSYRTRVTSATNLRQREGTTGHPCPKPLTVMRWVLERTTKPDACVLDPCMGSGSTLVAAKESNRRSIGIEVSEAYCEIAAKRLAQEVLDFGGVA